MDGSYEDSMMDNSGLGGNDGNKELSELVKQQMAVDYDQNGLKVHNCKNCNFTSKVTSNLRSHVECINACIVVKLRKVGKPYRFI